jgi:hypothetical protein
VTPDLERAGKRLGLVVVAVALVVSMALSGAVPGEGPIEEAAAVHSCDNTDALVYGFSFGYVNEDKCTNNHVGNAVEEVRQAESQQSKADLYSAAEAQKTNNQNFDSVYGNYLNDSESVAWMKAEKAIAEAYENGSTKSEAKVAAKEAIEDYYAVKQINLIESWNTILTSYEYLHNRSMQEGFSQDDFGTDWDRHGLETHFIDHTGMDSNNNGCNPETVTTRSATLANASSHDVKTIKFSMYESQNYYIVYSPNAPENSNYYGDDNTYPTGSADQFYCRDGYSIYTDTLMVDAPNSNYDDVTYYDLGTSRDRWLKIEQKNDELQNESDAFVDAIWQDYQDGNINSSDVISRNTQMFEYGTKAQNGSNYYDTIGATAAMGIETPQLEGTGTMTITDGGGTTHEGMLFGEPPNGSWTVGKTYDPANISGPVIMATTSGEEHELSRPFTVDAATDKEGNEKSTVETQRYNYQTSNTTEMQRKYDKLLGLTGELQERSESVDSNGGGGGGSSGGGSLPSWLTATYFGIPLWALAAVLLVALVLLGGDN